MDLFIARIFYGPVYGAFSKNSTCDHSRYYSNGLPIDYCLYPMKQCGYAAANKYCNGMNAGSVLSFKAARSNSPTYVQGNGETCDLKKYDHYDALTQIICGSMSY